MERQSDFAVPALVSSLQGSGCKTGACSFSARLHTWPRQSECIIPLLSSTETPSQAPDLKARLPVWYQAEPEGHVGTQHIPCLQQGLLIKKIGLAVLQCLLGLSEPLPTPQDCSAQALNLSFLETPSLLEGGDFSRNFPQQSKHTIYFLPSRTSVC